MIDKLKKFIKEEMEIASKQMGDTGSDEYQQRWNDRDDEVWEFGYFRALEDMKNEIVHQEKEETGYDAVAEEDYWWIPDPKKTDPWYFRDISGEERNIVNLNGNDIEMDNKTFDKFLKNNPDIEEKKVIEFAGCRVKMTSHQIKKFSKQWEEFKEYLISSTDKKEDSDG